MHPLVGVWSSDASGLHYSSFENVVLAFNRDGAGLVRLDRPGNTDLVRFTWRQSDPGWLALAYQNSGEAVDGGGGGGGGGGGASESEAPQDATLPTLVAYRITRETTPLAGRSVLLRLDRALMLEREFGLQTRDANAIRAAGTQFR
jgi:hypothetical protein